MSGRRASGSTDTRSRYCWRAKVNLDIFWLKDDSLDDPDLLPPPDEVAAEVVESLQTALERFRSVRPNSLAHWSWTSPHNEASAWLAGAQSTIPDKITKR